MHTYISQFSTVVSGIVIGTLLGVAAVNTQVLLNPQGIKAVPAEKVTICHATSSDVNPYNKITVSANAAYTQCDAGGNSHAGHFCEGGSPANGHENDILLQGDVDCPQGSPTPVPSPSASPTPTPSPSPTFSPSPSPTPSPSVTPSPSPSASLDPSPTPTATPSVVPSPSSSPSPSNSPTPTPTPSPEVESTPTPEPTPTSVGGIQPTVEKTSDLFTANATCDDSVIHAWHIVKYDDKPQANVKVTFRYAQKEKIAYTNNSGQASVSFDYTANDFVTSDPEEGYRSRRSEVSKETDCSISSPSVRQNGQVLGASTQPLTFAKTGTAIDSIQMINLIIGSASIVVGTVLTRFEK